MSKQAQTNPLLSLGEAITEEHLAELEAQIVATETKLAGMRRLQNVARAFLGKEVKGPGGNRKKKEAAPAPSEVVAPSVVGGVPTAPNVGPESVLTVARAVAKNGPLMAQKLHELTKLSLPTVYQALKASWFNRTEHGWELKPEGKRYLEANG